MAYSERTFGGGTHRVVTITDDNAMAESARFVALEQEAIRLRDLASAEMDAGHALMDKCLAVQAHDHAAARTYYHMHNAHVDRGLTFGEDAERLTRELAR